MGMKLKSGADLCGFQLTNFCVQGEASAPSDAALGRKYFHTNATDDVATGISLLNRERIYLGEGAWRATAYLDDIAGIQTKLDMILGDVDLDGVIENMNEVIKFLEDNKDTENLMTLLNGKLNKSGGTIDNGINDAPLVIKGTAGSYIKFVNSDNGELGFLGVGSNKEPRFYLDGKGYNIIHEGNIGSQKVAGLATPVTIWGQSFDGTGNVSGKLTSVTGIDFDTNVYGIRIDDYGNVCFRTSASVEARDWSIRASNGTKLLLINNTGNVLIGTTDDNGAKLQVEGSSHFLSYINASTATELGSRIQKSTMIGADKFGLQIWSQGDGITRMQVGRIDGQATAYDLYLQPYGGNVRIFGNLIVDGEVSAGGAGAEEGTSGGGGSVDFHSEDFTPSTSTTYQVNHNLGKKVIVQVYEQGATSETWNLVMVDVEIISATRLDLRFGKIEDTPHRVVVMGAGV